MSIEVTGIRKNFGQFRALSDVSLSVKAGEMVALLGPSGSGKTTLLRIIAGLEAADAGGVMLDGEPVHRKHVKERRVGFVFQHYALFKHMSVFENVAFGLRVRPKAVRPSDTDIRYRVMELLRLVHLDAFADRYPSQLSGGQRQRVALARALAVEPKVLLLDEPFGALDAKVRKELRRWMRRLHDNIHITSVFVTHDQEEAMEVADRVVVMSNGKIEQVGTPEEVYHQPANSFVYDFLGNYNEFSGWRDSQGAVHLAEGVCAEGALASPLASVRRGWLGKYPEMRGWLGKMLPSVMRGRMTAQESVTMAAAQPAGGSASVKLFARPHEMFVSRTADDGMEYVEGEVIHLNPAGSLVKIEVERKAGPLLQVEIPKHVVDTLELARGARVFVRPKTFKVFDTA